MGHAGPERGAAPEASAQRGQGRKGFQKPEAEGREGAGQQHDPDPDQQQAAFAESQRLFGAAHAGTGLNLSSARQGPPYTPAVVHSLAIAALAAGALALARYAARGTLLDDVSFSQAVTDDQQRLLRNRNG